MTKSDPEEPHASGVGYKRPPKHGQFKPGVSGNPSGKKRGSVSLRKEIERELNSRIVVTEQGRSKRVTKASLVARRLANDSIKGNHRATEILSRSGFLAADSSSASEMDVLPPLDREALLRIKARLDKLVKDES